MQRVVQRFIDTCGSAWETFRSRARRASDTARHFAAKLCWDWRNVMRRFIRTACIVALFCVGSVWFAQRVLLPRYERLLLTDKATLNAITASAPVLVLTVVSGGSGGPAPHHFSVIVDEDASSTGDAYQWKDCRFEARHRVNGATPTTRISCTDPINGATQFMDVDQHGACVNILQLDEGNGTVEIRARNGTGLFSSWYSTSAITVTARDTGKYCYVDGDVVSGGDGLSWATAKKTWNDGLDLAVSLGDGATMWWRGVCDVVSGTTITVANLLIREDPNSSATLNCSSHFNFITTGDTTNGLVVWGGTFTSINGGEGNIVAMNDAQTSRNICLYGCHIGDIYYVTVGSGNAVVQGISLINTIEDHTVEQEYHFGNATKGMLCWGVSAPLGSTTEHLFRLQAPPGYDCAYHSFQYCDLGCSTTKTCMRILSYGNLWVYGCLLRRTTYIGFVSPTGTSQDGTTFVFEACKFTPVTGQATDFTLTWYAGRSQASIRNCYFDRINLLFGPRNLDYGGTPTLDDVTIINNVFSNCIVRWNTTLLAQCTPTNQILRNNLFTGLSTSTAYIQVIDLTHTTGYDFSGNTISRADGTQRVLIDQTNNVNYGFTAYTGFSWVSNENRAVTTFDATTLQPDQGLTSGLAAAPFPHVSYYERTRYNVNAASYASGAWLDPAAAAPMNTVVLVPTAAGVLVLSTTG